MGALTGSRALEIPKLVSEICPDSVTDMSVIRRYDNFHSNLSYVCVCVWVDAYRKLKYTLDKATPAWGAAGCCGVNRFGGRK